VDGRTDGRMDGCTYVRMYGHIRMDGCTDLSSNLLGHRPAMT